MTASDEDTIAAAFSSFVLGVMFASFVMAPLFEVSSARPTVIEEPRGSRSLLVDSRKSPPTIEDRRDYMALAVEPSCVMACAEPAKSGDDCVPCCFYDEASGLWKRDRQ